MIYLDNAATSFPKPNTVINAVNDCMLRYSANPGRSGHRLSQIASQTVYNCRKTVKDFFSASGEEKVIFCASCTVALNMIIKGVLNSGDHVIISSLEHNAVLRPLNKLKKFGVEYDIARVFENDTETTVKSFEALIKPNTKMIICTSASNVFGIVLPLKEIGELCKNYGIKFTVDGAQGGGLIDINIQKMKIDYLACPAHKGLLGPMGLGILIAESDITDTIFEGGTGSMSKLIEQPDFMPDKFESGTLNLPAIAGTAKGIEYINRYGIENLYNREMGIIKYIYREMNKIGNVELYTSEPFYNYSVPVLSFNIRGKTSDEVSEKLNEASIATRPGLHCAPLSHKYFGTIDGGTVRISPSFNTTRENIEYFIYKIKNIAKNY